jgi:penicillin-insensitive murein endopeptidase
MGKIFARSLGIWFTVRFRWLVLGLAMASLPVAAIVWGAERSNDDLPEKYRKSPYTLMSLSVGSPSNGWQLRAKKLRPSGHLFIKQNSRNNSYGHPALVLMLERSAKQMARDAPGSSMLVGDLSGKYGGPLAKHRSHQSGRDADVGFFVTDKKGRSQQVTRFIAMNGEGKALDGSGYEFDDYKNWLLVQLWMKDTRARIMYVFVTAHLRRRLLAFAKARPAFAKYVERASTFLRQPSNSSAHNDHFHVRIACPDRQEPLCVQNVPVSD